MTLFVMCGCPGSGKSTWAKKNLSDAVYVSSDEIRMELFGTYEPGVDEDAVFDQFYGRIKAALASGKDAVADATNLGPGRRRKSLQCLSSNDEAVAIVMDTPLEECIRRNAERDRKVPEDAIRRMYQLFSAKKPRRNEGFREIRFVR